MSITRLKSLDLGLENTNIWLNEMMRLLDWDDQDRAYRGLRAVLYALRDRLTVDETAHLAAQLPMFLKALYYDGLVSGPQNCQGTFKG